jgi:hypothetical protein
MAYDSGTSSNVSHTAGVGVGMAGGRFGVGGGSATTHTTSMSTIAQKVAPPQKKSVSAKLWIACLLFLPALVVPIYLQFQAEKYNKKEFPKLYAQWEALWLCHRCGYAFVL